MRDEKDEEIASQKEIKAVVSLCNRFNRVSSKEAARKRLST